MAKTNTKGVDPQEEVLVRYRRIVNSLVKEYNQLIEAQKKLQKERNKIEKADRPDGEKKKEWNAQADEWRKRKELTLQKGVSKHKPIYTQLIGILLTLGGKDKVTFNNKITQIARDYDRPYKSLRLRTLNYLP